MLRDYVILGVEISRLNKQGIGQSYISYRPGLSGTLNEFSHITFARDDQRQGIIRIIRVETDRLLEAGDGLGQLVVLDVLCPFEIGVIRGASLLWRRRTPIGRRAGWNAGRTICRASCLGVTISAREACDRKKRKRPEHAVGNSITPTLPAAWVEGKHDVLF